MKITTLILSLLFTVGIANAGDPIPGVDVSLEQIPGGVYKTESDCVNHGGSIVHKQDKIFCNMNGRAMKTEISREAINLAENDVSLVRVNEIGGYGRAIALKCRTPSKHTVQAASALSTA